MKSRKTLQPLKPFEARFLSVDNKIKVLEIAYRQIGAEIQAAEENKHKVTVTICTLLIALAVFVLRSENPLSLIVTIALITLSGLCGVLTMYYLKTNNERLRVLFADLLRIEEIFGLFEPDNFITQQYLDSKKDKNGNILSAHGKTSVFMTDGLKSAKIDYDLSTHLHVIAVILATVCSMFLIGSSYYYGNQPTTVTKIVTTTVTKTVTKSATKTVTKTVTETVTSSP